MTATIVRINEFFREVFDNDELTVNWATTDNDVEGWDSLRHVTLPINMEKAFGVRFIVSEVAAPKNVGELADIIDHRLARP